MLLKASVIFSDHVPFPHNLDAQMIEDLGHTLHCRDGLIDSCMHSTICAEDYILSMQKYMLVTLLLKYHVL